MAASNYELIARARELPATVLHYERVTMMYLVSHRNAQTGECFPTVATLAREMGVSVRTVKQAIKRLATLGLLTVGKRKTRHGDGNTYAMNIPAIGAPCAPIDGCATQPGTVRTTHGNRCAPRTGIGAHGAPEQIKEQIKNRNETKGPALVSSRFSDSVPMPAAPPTVADLFSDNPSPEAIDALIAKVTDALGDEKPSVHKWRAFVKRRGARAFIDLAHNFAEDVRNGKEVANGGAYFNALLDRYEQDNADGDGDGDEITPEILAALEMARKAGKH